MCQRERRRAPSPVALARRHGYERRQIRGGLPLSPSRQRAWAAGATYPVAGRAGANLGRSARAARTCAAMREPCAAQQAAARPSPFTGRGPGVVPPRPGPQAACDSTSRSAYSGDENWVEAQARRPIQLGSRHRDRGFRENAGWAGRPCGLGCEPDLLCGRPCDLPGCAASTNPSLSFCPPGLPPTTIEEEATCDREDVRIVVEL